MKVLDLFSGIGGFSLGLERAGMETVAFCEIDPFCQKILRKHWPDVPIYDDVRSLNYEGTIDLICGGFPCQPFSVAGNQKGKEDDRHLWPAMFDIIKKHRPNWVIGENVAGFINMALDDVLADLESENYETRAFVIPACAVGAPHRRDRVWIVGYSEHDGLSSTKKQREPDETSDNDEEGKKETCQFKGASQPRDNADVADTSSQRQQRQGQSEQSLCSKTQEKREATYAQSICFDRKWEAEPDVGRVANGIPNAVDRLKSLGNAVVPQIPEIIGRAIMEINNDK